MLFPHHRLYYCHNIVLNVTNVFYPIFFYLFLMFSVIIILFIYWKPYLRNGIYGISLVSTFLKISSFEPFVFFCLFFPSYYLQCDGALWPCGLHGMRDCGGHHPGPALAPQSHTCALWLTSVQRYKWIAKFPFPFHSHPANLSFRKVLVLCGSLFKV